MAFDRRHIDRVFSQKFSLLDQKNLEKYFEDGNLNEEAKHVIEEQWEEFVPDTNSSLNLDSVYYKLYYNINNQKSSSYYGKSLIFKISQIAAILIVGILIASSIYFSGSRNEKTNSQQIEFISHSGFRNQFKLPDGTSGWLGYNSELKYYVDGSRQRVVELNGLAFFDVAHKKTQPFVVKTPTKLKIEVLGTRFNVSSYLGENSCEVILEQGSVKLNLQDVKVGEMRPNDRVIYKSENNSIDKSSVNALDYVSWKDGKLILDEVSLKETCIKLGRFYNVDFELDSRVIDNQRVRLRLEDETLDDALNLLTMLVPIKYKVEDRTILNDNSYSKKKITIKNK
jgi:ferric-dicitrate binding protein FerR (iron transport regulator)